MQFTYTCKQMLQCSLGFSTTKSHIFNVHRKGRKKRGKNEQMGLYTYLCIYFMRELDSFNTWPT